MRPSFLELYYAKFHMPFPSALISLCVCMPMREIQGCESKHNLCSVLLSCRLICCGLCLSLIDRQYMSFVYLFTSWFGICEYCSLLNFNQSSPPLLLWYIFCLCENVCEIIIILVFLLRQVYLIPIYWAIKLYKFSVTGWVHCSSSSGSERATGCVYGTMSAGSKRVSCN